MSTILGECKSVQVEGKRFCVFRTRVQRGKFLVGFEHTSVFRDDITTRGGCSAVFSIKAAQKDSSVIHAQFDFSHLHFKDPTGLGWDPVQFKSKTDRPTKV